MDLPSVAPPMPLKVRFADAESLCIYNKEDLESGVLSIVDSMTADGLGMCVSGIGVNKLVVSGISGSGEVYDNGDSEVRGASNRGGNGGDRYRGIEGDRVVSERSNDQSGEMVAVG